MTTFVANRLEGSADALLFARRPRSMRALPLAWSMFVDLSMPHENSSAADAVPSRAAEFERLALPLAQTLYATAYRLTGHAARAEDLVQEAYVLAWNKFGQFERGTNFKAWLFRILILSAKNEGRAQRKQPVALSDETALNLSTRASDNGPPAAAVSLNYGAFVDDDFKRALDRLDEDHRTVLLLVTLGELSYQECAAALSIPAGTVMSRLFRARKQLQSELREYALANGILRGGAKEKMP